jgi:hypothetical protein
LQVNREGQITDRFTRAIDQLGKTDEEGNRLFEVRIGGIYALARGLVRKPVHPRVGGRLARARTGTAKGAVG